MSRLTIDTGTAGNAATGDSLRTAFTKVNTNFEELYSELGNNGSLSDLNFKDNIISTDNTNQNLILAPNGTGQVIIGGFGFSGNILSTTDSNANIELDPAGTGNLILKSGDLLPATDNSQYLGSASKRWHTLYVGPGSINIDGVTLSASGGKLNMGADIEVNAISSADSSAIQINDGVNISGNVHMQGDTIISGRITESDLDQSMTLVYGAFGLYDYSGNWSMAMSIQNGKMVFEGNNINGYALVPQNNNQYTLGNPSEGPGDAGKYWKNVYTYNVNFPDGSQQTTSSNITVVGDDSTGTTINAGETIKIAGAGGVTTAVSGDTLTITGGGGDLGSLSITESTITSTDSSSININENLNVDGTLTASSINRLVLNANSSDGSSVSLTLDSPVQILAGAESDTKTYILPNGEAVGQTILLVRGSGAYDTIQLTCLKLKVDGTAGIVTFEPFSQYDHVVVMIWRGDCWASTRTGTTP